MLFFPYFAKMLFLCTAKTTRIDEKTTFTTYIVVFLGNDVMCTILLQNRR